MRRRQEKQKGRPAATGTALPRAAATACGPAFPPAGDTSAAHSFVQPC